MAQLQCQAQMHANAAQVHHRLCATYSFVGCQSISLPALELILKQLDFLLLLLIALLIALMLAPELLQAILLLCNGGAQLRAVSCKLITISGHAIHLLGCYHGLLSEVGCQVLVGGIGSL